MPFTVSQIKESAAGILSGININNIDNLNGTIERSARILVQKAFIPEASAKQNITLYDGVTYYPCDTRIFGTQINDIRRQGVSRGVNDYVYKKWEDDFDRTKGYLYNGTMATFEYSNGTPLIRIVSTMTQQKAIIDGMNSTTDWILGGTGSNLQLDSTTYYQEPASLRFSMTTGTSTLTKTISQQSLSSYEDVGVAFLALRLPDGSTSTNLTNIELRLGSDSSNYDSVTETDGFLGAWTVGEFILVAFDFSASTSTGTPNWAAIDYAQVRVTSGDAFTNIRVGGLWISQPTNAEILFQTSAIFKATGANPTTTITDDADTVILNDSAYTIFEYESALSILEETGAAASDSTTQKIESKLKELYSLYRGQNPSDSLKVISSWY